MVTKKGDFRVALFLCLILFQTAAFAEDTVTLKDGTVYHGGILFHNDSEYWISADGKVETIKIADIEKISFDGEAR